MKEINKVEIIKLLGREHLEKYIQLVEKEINKKNKEK